MTSQTLWDRIRQKPFKPFRVSTSDGKQYDVPHPETILLSKSRIVVALYDPGENPDEEPPSRLVTISDLHVASLEDVPANSQRA